MMKSFRDIEAREVEDPSDHTEEEGKDNGI